MRTLAAVGQSNTYGFVAAAGETVSITTQETGGFLNACWELYDPAGISLGTACGQAEKALPVAGAYAIRVYDSGDVETGTYEGEMVEAMRTHFAKVYSVELSPEHFKRAAERFAAHENVEIIFGDSALMLPDVLMDITEPALFWLDGHYSAGNTAKGDTETPILSELDVILRHVVKGHVILVDDARCFNGTADYPTLAQLEAYLRERRPDASFEVKDDIIRIT